MPHRSRRSALTLLLVALACGAALRGAWLTADPPVSPGLGIVWHDEGPWVHNARNRALWGHWRTDAWNPVFVAPVFTGLEYLSFATLGVGTWQARIVPLASGLFAIAAIGIGAAAIGGRRAGGIAAVLLATNYVFVMWNHAALMESTMTAFIVIAWAAYAAAARRPVLGLLAGTAATLAWFSKAAAAFFVAALVLDAVITLALAYGPSIRRALHAEQPAPADVRAALTTLIGLAVSAAAMAGVFVIPNWTEYRFYNWQMSVVRKPSYSIAALMDRASWLPIVHDFFTRMWLVMVAAALAAAGIVARLQSAKPGERLLLWWVLAGLGELIVHDSGNERRYVMFIPALVAMAAQLLGAERPFPLLREHAGRFRWLTLPLALLAAYMVTGSLVRLAFLGDIRAGDLRMAVRISAALAVLLVTVALWHWRPLSRWLTAQTLTARAATALVVLVVASDLAQYAQWVAVRTDLNHRASIAVGAVLPPGTLVHGKLANGLSLENRIRPVFIGRGFGNYEDRKQRDDVRYILTIVSPSLGYESQAANPVISDVLDAYPNHRTLMTFDIAETSSGRDRAALIDKFGTITPPTDRAHD